MYGMLRGLPKAGDLDFALSASGPESIIPSPGETPTVDPIPGTIRQTGAYTVGPGQTIFGRGLAHLFDTDSANFFGPLTNAGTIWSLVEGDDAYGFTYVSIARYNTLHQVSNSGLIVLETGAGLRALTSGFANADLTNTGSIFIISHANNNAFGLESGNLVDNSGLFAVRADNGTAVGMILNNGGQVTNSAAASLLVEGISATAIVMGDSPQGYGQPSRIDNAGRIEAQSLGNFLSLGIVASHIYGELELVNSGLIRADIAYLSTFGTTVAQPYVDDIQNTASGRIEGAILTDRGDDLLTNEGLIIGSVWMEEGDDHVVNTGEIRGAVDLGWGDDSFAGGGFADFAAGGDGDDILEGGDGDDLLVGGGNDDTLVGGAGADGLYGEYGNDIIFSSGADAVFGGEGDDRVELGDYAFAQIDGGAGFDTLVFASGARSLNLTTALAQGRLADIEAIEMRGGQSLSLGAADVSGLTGGETTLRIVTTESDTLNLGGGWQAGQSVALEGAVWRSFSLDGVTVLVGGAGTVLANVAATGTDLDEVGPGAAPLPNGYLILTQNDLELTAYELHQSITVNDEATWRSIDGYAVLTSFNSVDIVNNGALISFRPQQSQAIDPAFALGGGYNNFESVINNGLISVVNQGATIGGGTTFAIATGGFSEVENDGTITATTAGGRVTAVSSGTLVNRGLIEASSQAGAAITADLSSRGFVNYGTITAHSGGADMFSFPEFQGRPLSVAVVLYAGNHENHGVIRATSAMENGSAAVWCEVNGDRVEIFENTGTISGDTAIHVRGSGAGAMDLTNSGQLNGLVRLDGGDDRIRNTGEINGDVRLGAGGDIFDGSGGSQNGVVSGEDGDDQLTGGSSGDRLDGGAGSDVLIGAEGNDLLMGGDGVDVAVFRGSAAEYQIVVGDGFVTVIGADGKDTLADIEILRFDDHIIDLTRVICPEPFGVAAASKGADDPLVMPDVSPAFEIADEPEICIAPADKADGLESLSSAFEAWHGRPAPEQTVDWLI